MELVGLLALCLIIGLIIRKKGDNTMDTLSKGCGCFVIGIIVVIGIMVFVMITTTT